MTATAKTPEHPDIDADMWGKIDEVIDSNKDTPGCVITVLRECQDIVGYLPVELIGYISDGIGIPFSHVFGVTTFYSLFSLTPKGRHIIKACTGTACYVKGIKEVIGRIENTYGIGEGETTEDRRFSLEGVRCLGACGLAPVVVIGEDTHGDVTSDKILGVVDRYQ